MSTEKFANNAQTTLTAAITSTSATSISVASAGAFPSSAQYRIRIDDEIMIVTAGAGTTTWTVTRGAEGTTAATHANGASLTHVLTGGGLEQARLDFTPLSICEGRLTLQSGVPVSTSDQANKTTIFFTPCKGNRIALYDGTTWKVLPFSEISVAVPSGLFQAFDVFAYESSGAVTLETANWNQGTPSISAFDAGTQKFTTSAAHGLSVGDLIGIAGITGTVGTDAVYGANGRTWRVATVPTTTTFTCTDTSWGSLAYTSGGTVYTIPNTRATALTTQNGAYVKSGATTRRYLGTGMTNGGGTGTSSPTSGQCDDKLAARFLWNYSNRVQRTTNLASTDSHTYNSATQRLFNLKPDNRVELVIGVFEDEVILTMRCSITPATAGNTGTFGIGTNTSANAAGTKFTAAYNALNEGVIIFPGSTSPAPATAAGYNVYFPVEAGNAASAPTFTAFAIRSIFWG